MSKFSCAATQTGAKTASRGPTILVGNKDMLVTEVGIESTTAVSSQVALRKFTTAGAAGTALDEQIESDDGQAPLASVTQVPSADHTLVAGQYRISHLPAAVGGGTIWTFSPGIRIRGGTGDGLCLTLPGGSDAVINFHFEWEE